jgi:exodeoxyribonuclease VII large subunit
MAMPADASRKILTPSSLNRQARGLLEQNFPAVWVEGEISNLARPASGHLYFSLKDQSAQIRCALFRQHARNLAERPDNGQQVCIRGRLSVYEARGDYQLIVDRLEPAGEGELQRRFEALKKKLDSEGLFDAEQKKELPAFPLRIGVITSPSGAAIRDIIHVLQRRWPLATVRIYAVPVQGDEAAPAISAALQAANRQQWADLLIVGRGGGSLEDLWAFNEELVARAIAGSVLPVVSAIGHEIDFSIADFCADMRAPTPSAAAELVTPEMRQLQITFRLHETRITRLAENCLQQAAQKLDFVQKRLRQSHPAQQLQRQIQGLDQLRLRLGRSMSAKLRSDVDRFEHLRLALLIQSPKHRLAQASRQNRDLRRRLRVAAAANVKKCRLDLARLAQTLQAVSPLSTLGRGYAVLRSMDTGSLISAIDQASRGDEILAQLADGSLQLTVNNTSPGAPDPGALKMK